MAKPFVKADALVYTAQPAFDADAADEWWTAFDALQMVDRELRDVDRILRDRQKKPLTVRRIEGAHSPSDLARTVETTGWTPVDSTIRVSDVPKIVATLGGNKLYGDSTAAPIRELIQNGLDAITARRRLQGRPSKWGELRVTLHKGDDGFWLSFEDNGVGMSQSVLTGPLIDFGNSFWKSSLAIQEFPGLASLGMKSRGKYGIGFFSAFMLGEHIRVITRRYDRDTRSARVLEFRHGLGSRPNLRNADPKEAPIDGGTRVEIKLKTNPFEPGGLLYRKSFWNKEEVAKLGPMIAAIAPACEVAITVCQDDEPERSTAAADWLSISATGLLNRITGNADTDEPVSTNKLWEQLTELRDEEGKLYGRARIDVSDHWSRSGMLTVDGLAASKIDLVTGILIGVETTASRNSASPIVPAPVLASWSSEQAILIGAAELPDAEKARAAAIVMRCGGDFAELPVIWWRKEWMTAAKFTDTIKPLDRLELHAGFVTHDDDDDVTKREFESSFEADGEIATTVDGLYGLLRDSNWIAAITQGHGSTPVDVIEQLLREAWGEVEEDLDTRVVGDANGVEIHRTVTIYTPASEDDDEGN
jgi:hypothetical protein